MLPRLFGSPFFLLLAFVQQHYKHSHQPLMYFQLYLESDGRYTTIHLVDKSTLFVTKNLGEYEKLLSNSYFLRIHKKYLINLKYIININNSDGTNCELVGKLMLPVAKRRKKDLVSFLNIR